eukprot:14160251-Heterocapsa_arctica.AAC.1
MGPSLLRGPSKIRRSAIIPGQRPSLVQARGRGQLRRFRTAGSGAGSSGDQDLSGAIEKGQNQMACHNGPTNTALSAGHKSRCHHTFRHAKVGTRCYPRAIWVVALGRVLLH